jgi:diguanylate cyclase (GGDEF)-like protein/PAS domain S-box-containing protein
VIQPPDRQDAIHAEQVRLLFSGMPVSLATSALLAMLLAYVQLSSVGLLASMSWLALLETTLVARGLLYLSWRRTAFKADASNWLLRFRVGAASTGIMWGMASLLLVHGRDVSNQTSLAFALAGVTSGAVVTYSIDLFSTMLYVMPLMLPLIWRLFSESTQAGITMAGMTLLFMAFIFATARRQHHGMLENISLRFQAASGKTMLQKKESDLHLLNERLTALVEAIPDAIFFKDGKGRWLITNEAAKRLFRLHDIKWRGRTDVELAEARPEFRKIHEACLADDEKAWNARALTLVSEKMMGEDGIARDFEVRKVPMFGGEGGRKGLVIIGRDMTEQKRAEQELRIAAAAFDVQEGIIIADAENKILRVNRAFTRLTGYSAQEATGKTPAMLKSGRHDAIFYERMWEQLARDSYWQGEIWNRRKDGQIFPEWLTISAIRDTAGAVTHYIAAFSDITQYKEAEEAIHTLAFYDALTSLPNRRLLLDRLQQALTVSLRRNQHGAILFIDLDNFKTLNDTRGHDVGDLLLVEVAQRLTQCVRAEDTVARLGGDEFVVMLEGLSEVAKPAATQAELVGEKILEALNQPYLLRNYEHHSTPSIGVSLFLGEQETVEDLLKHADAAMYQAKQSGRNTLRFFDPAMQASLEARLSVEADLRQALPQLQFKLYYQPQVDEARRCMGAEVLLRWEHPTRGLVSPAEFIPIAEDNGLIVPIGFWVLQMACAQLKRWETHPVAGDLSLAVNVSARQFRQADLVDQVRRIITQTGVNPARLKLELTESTVLGNVNDTIAKMQALKALGISFSMDDFGTGHSSLAQLKRLPLDQVKIDQSFVRDIASDPNDAAIVQTIIVMTETMGLDVIAEGVETEAQLQFLRQHGCHHFQGYLFGKPMPLTDFEAALV